MDLLKGVSLGPQPNMHGTLYTTLYRKLNGMFGKGGKEHIFVDGNCKIQRVVTIQKLVILFFLLQAEGKNPFNKRST